LQAGSGAAYNFADSGEFTSMADFKKRRDSMQAMTPRELLEKTRQPIGTPELPQGRTRTRLQYEESDEEEKESKEERPAKRQKKENVELPPVTPLTAPSLLLPQPGVGESERLREAHLLVEQLSAENARLRMEYDKHMEQCRVVHDEMQETMAQLLLLFKGPSYVDVISDPEQPDIIALIPKSAAFKIGLQDVPNDSTKMKMTIDRVVPTVDQLKSIPEHGDKIAQAWQFATSKSAREAAAQHFEQVLPSVKDYIKITVAKDTEGCPYRALIYTAKPNTYH
jgi:hypothetical protein